MKRGVLLLAVLVAFLAGRAAHATPRAGSDLVSAGDQVDDAIYDEENALYALFGVSKPDPKAALAALDHSDTHLEKAGKEVPSGSATSDSLNFAQTGDDVARSDIKDGNYNAAGDKIADALSEKKDALDDLDDALDIVFAVVYGIKTPDSGASSIFSDGANLYVTENQQSKIAKLDPYPAWRTTNSATPKPRITEYATPTAKAHPQTITAGPDGALWFTESTKIGRLDHDGKLTEFPLPTFVGPYGIVAGPDHALWFTELSVNKIGRMTTTGKFTEFALPHPSSAPEGITVGPDHALWFVEETGNRIGRITTSGKLTEFTVPGKNPGPANIVAGPDHALWFTEFNAGKIGRITTSGKVTELPVKSPTEGPDGICIAPDGKTIAFTTYNASTIGLIKGGKIVSETAVGGNPTSITAGPGHSVWFTEYTANKIGRLKTS